MKRLSVSAILVVLSVLLLALPAFAQEAAPADKAPAAKAEAAPAAPAEQPPAEPASPFPPEMTKVLKYVDIMSAQSRRLRDFQCTFYKKEWKGKNLPLEKALTKWRAKPFSVYMKWVGSHKKNQEIIYVKGWNDNEIKAHKGSFPDITVSLDPKGNLAMADSRHTVMEAGFPNTVRLIAKDMKLAKQDKGQGWTFKDLGESKKFGEAVHCVEATSPGTKKYYAAKAHICMNKRIKLPTVVKIWKNEGGKVRLVEDYGYESCKINKGLSDKDFDPENPAYKF